MRNKKLLVALSAAMCLSMAACSAESSKENKESNSASAETTTKDSADANASKDAPVESKDDDVKTEPAQTDAPETDAPTEPATEEPTDEAEAPNKDLKEIIDEIKEAAKKPGAATLNEIGTFEAKGISFKDNNIYSFDENEVVTLHDYMGKVLIDDKAEYIEKLGNTGLYAYRAKGEEETIYEGLIDAQGNEVVSADEKAGLFEEIDDRFIMAFFPEAETDNKDEAIYYATKRQFSLEAKDDDVFYVGKVKVYDSVGRRFLENTTETYAPRYNASGDIIYYYDKDYNTIVVTAEDEKIELDSDLSVTGARLFTCYKNDKTYAYDHDMNLMFTTPYSVSALNNTDDLYMIYDSDNKARGIIHYSGTVVIEPKYYSIDYLGGGYFSFATTDDYQKNGIADIEGNELTKEEYKYITYLNMPGLFSAAREDGKYDVLNVISGKKICDGADYGFREGDYVKTDDKYAYYVIDKDELAISLKNSGTYLGNLLLNSNTDKTTYDLVTGEVITKDYDKIYTAFGYIYVIKDNTATVYEVER